MVSPEKKGGMGGNVFFKIWVYFSLSYSYLIGNTLVFPNIEPFIVFFLPCPAEERSNGAAVMGTWHPGRVNPVCLLRRVRQWLRGCFEADQGQPTVAGQINGVF